MKIPAGYPSGGEVLSPGARSVLVSLNRDYLDLLVAAPGGGPEPLGSAVMQALRVAPADALDAVAACSYALFAMPVGDAGPAGLVPPAVHDPATRRYGGIQDEGGAWPAFTMAAAFFAWHVSRNNPLSARVMLGFTEAATERVARLDPWQLRHVAARQPVPPRPRWADNPCFWPELLAASLGRDGQRLALARLLGLQLLAADHAAPRRPAPAGTNMVGCAAHESPVAAPADQDLQERRPGAEGH